jgi:hydroxyacylglutathione hydrolase
MLYPSHHSGSVCGRGLSGNPISTIGFERRHDLVVQFSSEDEFVQSLMRDVPPTPEQQSAIMAANRSGRPLAEVM